MQNFRENEFNINIHSPLSSFESEISKEDFDQGITFILEYIKTQLTDFQLSQIDIIAHRLVHGGEKYLKPITVDSETLSELEELTDLAPLHHQLSLAQIKTLQNQFSDLKQMVVFDTLFFQSVPKHAFLYALNYDFYSKYGLRRFGFHGLSHEYSANYLHERFTQLGKKEVKHIACHIGSGCSVAAILNGQALDSTFGFGPQSGLMMASRAGDIDSPALLYLHQKTDLSLEEIETILNKQSGLRGVSKFSPNLRNLFENESDPACQLAIEMYVYRIRKAIGAMAAVLDGVDVISFSGGAGENSYRLRQRVLERLNYLEVELDHQANTSYQANSPSPISKPTSKTEVWVIPAQEEFQIAKLCFNQLHPNISNQSQP